MPTTTSTAFDTQTKTGKIGRSSILAYGLVSYAIFFATFLYAIGFVGDFGVAKTLDSPATTAWPIAVAVNLGLLTLFALQHSVMARPWFKKLWVQIIPQAAERSTYVLFSSVALAAIFAGWQPVGGVIWQATTPWAVVAWYAGFAFGWGLVFISTCLINHFDLFGVRQVWLNFRERPYTQLKFVTPWPYRVVRHPLYLGWLFAFWCTPTMSAAHLLFAVVTTAYILVAIRFEERDLIREHGDYVDYQRTTPMIIPGLKKR